MKYSYANPSSGTFSVGTVGVEDVDCTSFDFTYVRNDAHASKSTITKPPYNRFAVPLRSLMSGWGIRSKGLPPHSASKEVPTLER